MENIHHVCNSQPGFNTQITPSSDPTSSYECTRGSLDPTLQGSDHCKVFACFMNDHFNLASHLYS